MRVPRDEAIDVQVFGRLAKGANLDAVQQALAPAAAAIKAEVGRAGVRRPLRARARSPPASSATRVQALIWTLLVAVGFVLLIACANVSNLLLARSAYRVRETTVRSALGASRGRLVMHMLAEGFVISAIATFIGLLLASIALDGMQLAVFAPARGQPELVALRDRLPRAASVAVGAALLSTVIAGLPAAIRASRPSLDSLLRDGGRTGTGLAIGRIAWGLVVFEVALACLLLGVSALMTKSVLNATTTDVGVETDDIMTARVGLTAGTYTEDADSGPLLGNAAEPDPGAARASRPRRSRIRCRATAAATARVRRGARLRRQLDQAVRQPRDREPVLLRDVPPRADPGPACSTAATRSTRCRRS